MSAQHDDAPIAEMAEPALRGIRVIDLSRVLGGPYCSQILGDHGADVIKVEPPQGDETRSWGPPQVADGSAYYTGVNRNKRGIVLDLRQAEQRDVLLGLLAGADVLIENFKPGTLERWGLGYQEVLASRFPKLIHCRVSGFGADGPLGGLPGYDAAIQALCGLMSVNGTEGSDPLRIGIPIVDMVTGLNAALGILLAMQERQRSGRGQFVEAALFDCALSVLHPFMTNFLYSGKTPVKYGNAHPNITPYDSFQTATCALFLAVGNDAQYRKFCTCIERPDLADDPSYATNELRNAHRVELGAQLRAALADVDGNLLADTLIRHGVPCAPVLDVPGIVAHPHTAHRQMLVRIDEDYVGTASPIKLERSRPVYARKPPRFGEHTEEVLAACAETHAISELTKPADTY